MNDKRKEYLKKWREDNKEHIRNYKKEYAKTHDSSFKKLQDKYKQLQQENKILKENAKNNDKVVDKVNWENMLLKKENKQLKAQIEEYQKALDETMSEKIDIQNNWNELKVYIKETKLNEFEKSYGKRYGKTFTQAEIIVCNMILDKMQELEQGSDSNVKD